MEPTTPATVAQESETSLTTEGQRKINLMWETTQSKIALFVVVFGMIINAFVVFILVISSKALSVEQIALISMCLQFVNLTAGIVIGFYFSRTNHASIGGVGTKPSPHYEGR
jgi:hypothetical protein